MAISVELEIGRKTAQVTLDPLIPRVTLQVVFKIAKVFVFEVALRALVPELLLRANHFSYLRLFMRREREREIIETIIYSHEASTNSYIAFRIYYLTKHNLFFWFYAGISAKKTRFDNEITAFLLASAAILY